jgi:glycosidase
MRPSRWKSFSSVLFALLFTFAPVTALADDFKNEVIYQIFTDRFFDGSSANNNPAASPGLFDPTRSDLRQYLGGDYAGIQQKMSYLKGMGVTAIWISPPFDNCNVSTTSGIGYHGYWARDFMRPEEHFGNGTNTSWADFDALVASAHANNIKVIVDFAPNHTSPNNSGEFGALFNNGVFMGNINNDPNGFFHHNPNIADFNDRYQVQYFSLAFLSDLNQEVSPIDAYLKDSLRLLQQHGVDGFRVDAVKHITWGWEYSLSNAGYTNKNSFFFGEWFQNSTSDPLYPDSAKFANKSGISLLDFPLAQSLRDVFGSNAGFQTLDATMDRENADYKWSGDFVTFIDNHDITRFLTLNNNQNRMQQALAYILTSRGIPCIYYGTEQYLNDSRNGGGDPFNRPFMTNFSTTTPAYQLISRLSALRQNNRALGYGTTRERYITNDIYIYERRFFNNVVVTAFNKSGSPFTINNGLFAGLPAGTYGDYLNGLMNGASITVGAGAGGNNPVGAVTLPAGSVSVWTFTDNSVQPPQVGSIGPTSAQAGVNVTIGGLNFGSTPGTVRFGTTAAQVVSWTPKKIVVRVPSVASADYKVTVTNASGQASNTIDFTVLGGRLVPVTFTVFNASRTNFGENIYLTGSGVELSNWGTTFNTAVGPMLAPNYPNWFINVSLPAGATVQFKCVKIRPNGTFEYENGPNHTYTVPTSGTGFVNFNWQY